MQDESTAGELEKSGLTNEYDFGCAESPASTNDTIGGTHTPGFNFDPFGSGLAEFIYLWYDFNAAPTASATATTTQNENEIKMKYEGEPHSHTQTQTQTTHPTAPVIDSNDKISPTGVGLREFNNVGCVFGGILFENGFYYHENDIFDDYFNENFMIIIFHHLVCYFWPVCLFNHLQRFICFWLIIVNVLMDIGLFWMFF